MRYGFLISMIFFMHPLFSQTCEEIAVGPIRYFEGEGENKTEILGYFTPCSKTPTLTFSFPETNALDFSDPNPDTPAGLILVLLTDVPEQPILGVEEFSEYLYRDPDNDPIYFTDPSLAIDVSEIMNIGNSHNEYVLMPVLVDHVGGTGPASWFEEDCVRLYPSQKLTLIENPEEGYEFRSFDEISFVRWPSEIAMTEYYDIKFYDQETGNQINHTPTDSRSFRLEFPKAEGIFRIEIKGINNDCLELVVGVNWSFPTVGVTMDTARGFRNIEKCVPVRGHNMESISGFQLSLAWNPDSLEFTAVKNIHPALEDRMQVSEIASTAGRSMVHLSWKADGEPLTLPDSDILFEWCGKAKAEAGNFVRMEFINEDDRGEPSFEIYGIETNHHATAGGIEVMEDRDLTYVMTQMCNTREGNRRVLIELKSEDAYPYHFSVEGVLDTVLIEMPFLIPDLAPGPYQLTLRDSFGFEKTTTFTVKEDVDPRFEMKIDPTQVVHPTCLHPFGGEIGITLTPEENNYDLVFLNDDVSFIDQHASGLVAGTYIIEAEDENGCVDTLHYFLPNPTEVQVGWDVSNLVFCPGVEEVYLELENRNNPPDPSVEYRVGEEIPRGIEESYAFTEPGTYSLQLWNEDGCILDTVVVVKGAPTEITIWDTAMVEILKGDTLMFSSPRPEEMMQVEWEFDGSSIGDDFNVEFSPENSGYLLFNAVVHEQCTYHDSLWVEVVHPITGPVEFEFPNAFTPNGDGVNDVYNITPTREIRQIRRMEVYDRYGNYIFEQDYTGQSHSNPGWDGRSSGVDVPSGIYPVVIELEMRNGEHRVVSFEVMVVR